MSLWYLYMCGSPNIRKVEIKHSLVAHFNRITVFEVLEFPLKVVGLICAELPSVYEPHL